MDLSPATPPDSGKSRGFGAIVIWIHRNVALHRVGATDVGSLLYMRKIVSRVYPSAWNTSSNHVSLSLSLCMCLSPFLFFFSFSSFLYDRRREYSDDGIRIMISTARSPFSATFVARLSIIYQHINARLV